MESNNIGFLLVTICALVTSTLTLASFVKVTQSVFFGQLPKEYENVKEVPFGMRLAMGILAALCIVTGLIPNYVTRFLTEPAAKAAYHVGAYINGAMGGGYAESVMQNVPAATDPSFIQHGVWSPVSWLCLLMIALLALTVVATSAKYDKVSLGEASETKYQLFYGGEANFHSQVGSDDLFWGFKHNWRHYFSFMHELHSGVVNDYALWAVVALALAILYALVVL